MVLLLLLSGGMIFWFFGEGWFLKSTRSMGTGFQRHGLETSSEFVKIWNGRAIGNGQGSRMQSVEVMEQKQSVS